MFNGDDAGRGATQEIAERLERSVFLVKTIDFDDRVQPDQLSEEQLKAELDAMMV